MTAISTRGRTVRLLVARPGQKTRPWAEITGGSRAGLPKTHPWVEIAEHPGRTGRNTHPWVEIAKHPGHSPAAIS